jgi:hypothetical protein
MSGQSQQETISFEVTALNGLFLHTVDIFLVGSGNISQFVFVTADAKTTALANGAGDTSLQIGPSFGGALESLFFTETLTVGGNAPSSSSSAMDDKFGAFTGVTEPATHSLLTLGLAGVGFMSRRKKGRAP